MRLERVEPQGQDVFLMAHMAWGNESQVHRAFWDEIGESGKQGQKLVTSLIAVSLVGDRYSPPCFDPLLMRLHR